MAKSHYQWEKRQRDLAKKKKQEEKRQRKMEKSKIKSRENPDQAPDEGETISNN
jgi:hypothetical protein